MRFIKIATLILGAVLSYLYLDKRLAEACYDLPLAYRMIASYFSFLTAPSLILALSIMLFFIFLILKKYPTMTLLFFRVAVCVGFVMFFVGCLKLISARARPYLYIHENIYGFFPGMMGDLYRSFPSSHTAVAFCLAQLFSYYNKRHIAFAYLFACLIGLARIVALRHFLSDAIIGGLLGVITTQIYFFVEHKIKQAS